MTKEEMVQSITERTGVSHQTVKQIVQLTLNGIIDVIAAERGFELRDFGVFKVRIRRAKKARNPRTGAEVSVPSRAKVCFKAGKTMREKAILCGGPPPAPSMPSTAP